MKKLYIILIAALLLTLAACLTACSAKPVSLRGTEAPNLPGPTNDALKVTDEGQDWNITLEQVDKENFAEDDRLLAKGSYQVFQLNQEGSGDTLTATAAAAEGINAYFEQWRKDQLQFLGDVTNLARDAYAGVNGEDSRWEQPEYVYSDTVTTDYWVGPELLCVEMHYSSYSGGAHPNSWRVAVSFDLNTGEAVKIMDLAEDSEGLRAAVKENLLYQIRESDIWAEYGAEAFFEDYEDTVGNWADQYPEQAKAIVDSGNELMNHSNAHDHYNSLTADQIIADVNTCNDKIEALTGVRPTLIRCPYGEYDDHVISAIRSMGMEPIQWDVDSLDWKDYDAGTICKRVRDKLAPASIVLFHNAPLHTPEALPSVLEHMIREGYTVVPIGQLIYWENYTIDHTGRQFPAETAQ